MLDRAPVVDGMRFERGDIAVWSEPGAADVIVANASLHWVDDHAAVLAPLAGIAATGRSADRQPPGQRRPSLARRAG